MTRNNDNFDGNKENKNGAIVDDRYKGHRIIINIDCIIIKWQQHIQNKKPCLSP